MATEQTRQDPQPTETGAAAAAPRSRRLGLASLGALGVAIAAAIVVLVVLLQGGGGSPGAPLPVPDTPPAEFIYLDSARVSEYLGEYQGGLAGREKRTSSLSANINSSLAAGTTAQLGASQQSQQTTEVTVSASAADRFYTLLRVLKRGAHGCAGAGPADGQWLGSVNAVLAGPDSADRVSAMVRCIGDGGFIRINNAHLYLPPYAAALPRARATLFVPPGWERPLHPFTAANLTPRLQRGLHVYSRALGRNPRLPFIVPTQSPTTNDQGPPSLQFFVPARYRALTNESSLLSGPVTIVGKIVYGDTTRATARALDARFPDQYRDIATVTTFGRALAHAPRSVLDELRLCRSRASLAAPLDSRGCQRLANVRDIVRRIQATVTFKAPFAVVLPLAIYR